MGWLYFAAIVGPWVWRLATGIELRPQGGGFRILFHQESKSKKGALTRPASVSRAIPTRLLRTSRRRRGCRKSLRGVRTISAIARSSDAGRRARCLVLKVSPSSYWVGGRVARQG